MSTNSSSLATFTLVAFILLPFFMWFGISRANNQTSDEESTHQSHPEVDAHNVAQLSDYKKDVSDDDIKKAS